MSDDTAALQAAIDAVQLAGGGEVFLPKGTYTVSSTLTVTGDNVTIRGAGWSTVIKVADGAVTASGAMRHVLYVTADNFRLADLQIDGNGANQTQRVYTELVQLGEENASGSAGVSTGPRYESLAVERCSFVNAISGHIRVFKCRYVTIAGNRCSGVSSDPSFAVFNIKVAWTWDFLVAGNYCDFAGAPRGTSNNIFVTHTGNSGSGSERGQIVANEVADSTDSPIEASSSSSGSGLAAICRDIQIIGNVVRNGAGIISLQSQDVVIADNVVIAPGSNAGNDWGIRLGGSVGSSTTAVQSNVVVTGNLIRGSADTGKGIDCSAHGAVVRRVLIQGNHIVDVAKTGAVGIRVDGSSVASPNHTTDVAVLDNQLVGVTGTELVVVNLVAGAAVQVRGTPRAVTKTANYTATLADGVVLVDTTAGDVTISLPSALGLAGHKLTVQRTAGGNNILLDPAGTETVDGSATPPGTTRATIVSDGANWWTI